MFNKSAYNSTKQKYQKVAEKQKKSLQFLDFWDIIS